MRRAAISAFLLLLVARPASAQNKEAAKLFDEGVTLLDQGRVAEACPKLEASKKLEPAAGTLLNLAGCYERSGRRARALATFREAREASRVRGRADWQKVAEERIQKLTAILPKLTVFRGSTPGAMAISLDGTALADADLGTPQPVDAGPHTVVAQASGRRPFSQVVSLRESGSLTVTVPLLEVEGAEPPSKPVDPVPRKDETVGVDGGARTRHVAGVAAMAAGGAALVLFGISAIVAKNALDDAKDKCPDYPGHCSAAASDPNDRADTWSTIATVSVVASGVLLAGGAALFFLFTPSPKKTIQASFDGTRVVVGGRF